MKINWGKGIVIAIILFMSFILYFVFKIQGGENHEMVVEKYYQKELTFEKEMQKEKNAKNLIEKVVVSNEESTIKITFPKDYDYSKIKGKVSLYRPSSQKLDFEIPISLTSSYLLIPKNNLAGGRWDISIDWNYDGVDFLNKETINL